MADATPMTEKRWKAKFDGEPNSAKVTAPMLAIQNEVDLLNKPRLVLPNRVLRRIGEFCVVDAVPRTPVAVDVALTQPGRVARHLGYRRGDLRLVDALKEPLIGVVRTVGAGEAAHRCDGLGGTGFFV